MFLLNPVGWLVGALTTFLIAIKIKRGLKTNINIVAKQQLRFFVILTVSFLFYSIPPLLIADLNTLWVTYLIADALLFISLIFQGIIFWSLFLHRFISKSLVVILLSTLGIAAWITAFLSPPPVYNGILIYRNLTNIAAILQGFMIAIPLLPNGVYFLVRGIKIKERMESVKGIGFGLLYLIVAGQQVYIDMFLRARETLPLTILNIVSFSMFSLILLSFAFTKDKKRTREP